MKSIIKYLIYFLAVILIIWWFASTFQGKSSSNPTQENSISTELNDTEDDDISLDEILEDSDEEETAPPTDSESTVSQSTKQESTGDEEDDIMIDDTSVPDATQNNPSPPSSASSGTSGGRYFVIVGSFIIPGNAQSLKKKLEDMGYPGAEVVNFDLSEYHTVIAGRYGSLSEAKTVARALKASGVDAYVQRKKR